MARFEVSGMEATLAMIKAREAPEAAIRKAVKAGAAVIVERLKQAAPVDDGDLRGSIKADPVTYSAADGYSSTVGPTGNDPKTGEPLAKIGNILEYGRSYGRTVKPPLGWFYPTIAAAETEVQAAIEDTLRRELDK